MLKELTNSGFKLKGVIHVGAHEGQEIPEYQKLGLNILCFEPLPEAVDKFKQNYPDIDLIPMALGNYNQMTELNVSSDGAAGQASSLLEFLPENIGMTGELKRKQLIKEMRFKTFMQRQSSRRLSNYDTVVIDVQGYELNVLKGFGSLISRFNYFVIECSKVPIYKKGATAKKVVKYMTERGFIAITPIETHDDIYFIKEELWNRLLMPV